MKTPPLNQTTLILGAVVVAAVWLLMRGVGGVAKDIAVGAVSAVGGATSGAVVGVGQVIGIPDTNLDQCEIDIKNGNYWEASKSCPAARFIRYSVTGK